MSSGEIRLNADPRNGLLVDTNLLVLYTVGTVNRNRIENFKRTCQYGVDDFNLLVRVMGEFNPLYCVAHVAAEVSNLTDLAGRERLQARNVLGGLFQILVEPPLTSLRACQSHTYERLGLVDGAIEAIANEHDCAVLTDDLDLYVALHQQGVPALNFTHLRAQNWGV